VATFEILDLLNLSSRRKLNFYYWNKT